MTNLQIEEYKTLRQEALQRFQNLLQIQILTISLVVVAIGFIYINLHLCYVMFLLLAVNLAVLLSFFIYNSILNHIYIIGTYLSLMYEGKNDEIFWIKTSRKLVRKKFKCDTDYSRACWFYSIISFFLLCTCAFLQFVISLGGSIICLLNLSVPVASIIIYICTFRKKPKKITKYRKEFSKFLRPK